MRRKDPRLKPLSLLAARYRGLKPGVLRRALSCDLLKGFQAVSVWLLE